MEDDSYPPGNYAPEPYVPDEQQGEGAYADASDQAAGAAGPSSSSTTRGNKRKREAPDASAPLTAEQIQAKLHHLNRSLLASAKKAQTFELQRLHKHKKDAKRDVSKDPELDGAISILKSLSLPPLVASSLHSKLAKSHLFTHYPILAPLVPAPPPPAAADADGARAKAGNRVLSNKAFAKEMAEAIKRVKTWVDGEFKVQEKARAREEQAEGKPASTKGNKGKAQVGVTPAAPRRTDGDVVDDVDGSSSSSSDGEAGGPLPDMVSDDDDDDDPNPEGLNNDYFSGGSDSDDDDDDGASQVSWSSGSISSLPPAAPTSKKAKPSRASPPADAPPTGKDKSKAKSADKVKPIPKKVTSSLFLPSLAAGFTFGGSDSEPEALSDEGEKGERKNRRGQRARKAIWEKKYGANANHLKAQRADGSSSSSASGPPPVYSSTRGTRGGRGGFLQSTRGGPAGRGRGGAAFVVPAGTDGGWGRSGGAAAVPSAAGGGQGAPAARGSFAAGRGGGSAGRGGFGASSRGGFSAGGGGGGAGGGGASAPPRDKKKEKELHPSWVAKQKLKEKMSAGVQAAGKKITFD